MALTTRQSELVVSVRQTMEQELIKHLNDNVGNKLSPALGTGILSFVSAAAERLITEMDTDDDPAPESVPE